MTSPQPVTVVDAPCGKGKTTWAIDYMNCTHTASKGQTKFLFITPYLDEVARIEASCADLEFIQPTTEGRQHATKSLHLKELIADGRNIVSTHALFGLIDSETIELLEGSGYSLILDEVMDVVHQVPISKPDMEILFELCLESMNRDESGRVMVRDEEKAYDYLEEGGKFAEYIRDALNNRLFYVKGRMLMWEFPCEIFGIFESVHILTFMFDGQIQKAYFDLYGVPYRYQTVERISDGPAGEPPKVRLVDMHRGYDADFRELLRSNLSICEDVRLNAIGNGRTTFSSSWFKDSRNKAKIRSLNLHTENYLRKRLKAKAKDILWTTFEKASESFAATGFRSAFLAHTIRATNDYRDRTALAYCLNKFVHLPVQSYLKAQKATPVNEDRYALSELIQWMMRSALRDGKPISLYIPSKRMRELLQDYIAGGAGELKQAA